MPQPKGKTGNPNGRPKGVPNKVTATIRSWLVNVINDNRQLFEQDLKNLDSKERLELLQKMLPYLMPKVESDWEVEGACYDKEAITDEQLGWADTNKKTIKRWYE